MTVHTHPASPAGILKAHASGDIDLHTAVTEVQDWATRCGINFALDPLIKRLPGWTITLTYTPGTDSSYPMWHVSAAPPNSIPSHYQQTENPHKAVEMALWQIEQWAAAMRRESAKERIND